MSQRKKLPHRSGSSEIQSSLARGGYYQGDPNGKWDSNTVAAMQKFQSANGLDPSGKLDATSLQKLGLGSGIAGVSAPRTPTPAQGKSCCSASPSSPSSGSPATPPPAAPAASPKPRIRTIGSDQPRSRVQVPTQSTSAASSDCQRFYRDRRLRHEIVATLIPSQRPGLREPLPIRSNRAQ